MSTIRAIFRQPYLYKDGPAALLRVLQVFSITTFISSFQGYSVHSYGIRTVTERKHGFLSPLAKHTVTKIGVEASFGQ